MAINKVQLQRGLPMLEFFDLYASQVQCEEVLRSWRWPQGFVCPACGGSQHSEFRRHSRLYFQCCACRHQCSLIAGTIFESSKLPLPTWFVAMHLITQSKNNVSALELKRHLGVSWPTAWMMKHKIMQVMFEREETRQLTGRWRSTTPTSVASSTAASLAGVAEQDALRRGRANDRVPRAATDLPVGEPFTKGSIEAFAAKSLAAPATLVSDGLGCFSVVQGTGILHEPHITGGGAACVKHPSFLAVNTVLGNLKTAFAGTYHSFRFAKYAHRYLAQVQYLFNRRFNLRTILMRLIRAACCTKPHPLRAVMAAEHS